MTQASSAGNDRQCPVCHAVMTITKQGRVELDVCETHGVWLDRGELEAIVERIHQRNRGTLRIQTERARDQGKVSGILLGPLAFLFD